MGRLNRLIARVPWRVWGAIFAVFAAVLVWRLGLTAALGWLVLVVGGPLNARMTWLLFWMWRGERTIPSLLWALVASASVLLSALVFGLIFVNNDAVPPWVGLDVTKHATRTAEAILVLVPATLWLLQDRNGSRAH